jgi:membrane protease YdiL (CAAX protease family)
MDTEPAWQQTWRAAASPEPEETNDRRRRAVTVVFLLLGAVTLGLTLHLHAGDRLFYPATFALAGVWIVGAFASGPLHLGVVTTRRGTHRPWLEPVIVGIVLAGVFAAGGAVVREVPYLGDRVAGVLDYTRSGSLPLLLGVTALNGVAEELFFRGALFAALRRAPVLLSTLVYTVVTLATGNVMLAVAALVLGLVVGVERRITAGVLAPILTHVSWSLAVLVVLPPIFHRG